MFCIGLLITVNDNRCDWRLRYYRLLLIQWQLTRTSFPWISGVRSNKFNILCDKTEISLAIKSMVWFWVAWRRKQDKEFFHEKYSLNLCHFIAKIIQNITIGNMLSSLCYIYLSIDIVIATRWSLITDKCPSTCISRIIDEYRWIWINMIKWVSNS